MIEQCLLIEIFPDALPYFTTTEGRLYLDVDDASAISLARGLENYDGVLTNNILEDIELSVPMSPKNHFYLKHLYDPATDISNGGYITARISMGSDTLFHERLYGISKNSETMLIRLALVESNDWVTALDKTLLKDIVLPQIDFSKENIVDKWENDKAFVDGGDGYWFPIVRYGGWMVHQRGLVVEDLRPFLHALYLLRNMFDHIGWCFNSPFYETTFGRSLNTYLLKNDYGNTIDEQRKRLFYANIHYDAGELVQIGNVVHIDDELTAITHKILENWTEYFDYAENFNPVTGMFSNGFEGKFKVKIVIGQNASTAGFNIELLRRRFNPLSGEIEIEKINEDKWVAGGIIYTGQFTFNFEADVIVLPDEEIYLAWWINSNITEYAFNYSIDIYFSNEVKRTYYARNDQINMNKEVDQELTCLEVFRGLQHLISGITDTDISTKTLTLYTPYDADIFGETITGYYRNNFINLIDKQVIDSMEPVILDRLRYVKLAFAKSTDFLFERRLRADGTEYFSKTIDLGNYLPDGAEEDVNPLFEPTELLPDYIIGITTFGSHEPFQMMFPSMTDNNERKVSLDIKPRILYNVGYGRVNTIFNFYWFENEYMPNFAFACQHPGSVEFNGAPILERLVYGDEESDLWSLVYSRFYMMYNARHKLNPLVYLNNNQFIQYSLRDVYQVELDGHPIAARLFGINDHSPCDIISTPLLLLPESLACAESDVEPICDNFPVIVEAINDNCRLYSISGNFYCNVVSISWEKKGATESVWTDLGTSDTAEVCDTGEPFQVRAIVVYDCEECENSIVTKWFFPCNRTLSCTISPTFSNGQECLFWTMTSNYTTEGCEVIATLQIYIDGELDDTIILAPGDLICPINPDAVYILTVTVDCGDACPISQSTCTYISMAPPPNTCDNFPILLCNPIGQDGTTCHEFLIGGSQSQPPETFIVTWTCLATGETGTWHPGDPPVCCDGIIEAHALVFYCDCPTVCTDTIQCEGTGCIVFDPGVWNPIIVCN